MKYVRKIAAAVIAVVMLIAGIYACTPSKKVQDEVYDYLNEKYNGLEFSLLDYTQEKETNGRYTVSAKCLTTDVEFEIYVSSLFITDSYAVSYANSVMDPQILNVLGNARSLACVEDVQWLDLYEKDSNGYRFDEVDPDISYDVKDVNEIYRIRLADIDSANEAAQCVYLVMTSLDKSGIELDYTTFEFTLDETPILFSTDTASVKEIPLADLESKFYAAESQAAESGNILYSTKSYKEISYFMDGSKIDHKDE